MGHRTSSTCRTNRSRHGDGRHARRGDGRTEGLLRVSRRSDQVAAAPLSKQASKAGGDTAENDGCGNPINWRLNNHLIRWELTRAALGRRLSPHHNSIALKSCSQRDRRAFAVKIKPGRLGDDRVSLRRRAGPQMGLAPTLAKYTKLTRHFCVRAQ